MKKTTLIITLLISIISFSQAKKYITYKVTDNETITSIAKKIGVTPFDLLKLNPDAKDGINIDEVIIIPNKNFKVNTIVASTSSSNIVSQKDSIKDGILYHKVRLGETIYSLSKKYKIKKKKILKFNKLKKRSKLALGQVLKFPTKKANTFYKKPEVIESKLFNYTVKPDDTKYALARKHQISVEELEKINPILKGKTLNEYDVISLPNLKFKSNKVIVDESIYKTHTVQPKETFYSLTKLYGVSEESLKLLNQELNEGLKEGMVIKIPNNIVEETVTQTKMHLVKKKETLYSLTRLFKVTEEDLINANPELKDGLKEGVVIKIPSKITVVENLLNIEKNFTGKKLEVVLMLPFKAKEKVSVKNDKDLNRITDFYLGAVMALENIKSKGLSVNLRVFDTNGKAGKTTVSNIVNTNDFSNTDVIIGPMYFRNLEQITKTLRNDNLPIISPVANNDHTTLNAINIVQNAVSKKQFEKNMLDFIRKNYSNQELFIIASDEKETKSEVTKIVNYLKEHDSINNITVLNLEKGYIKLKVFEKNIDKKKENWVIVMNDKEVSKIAVEGFKSTELKATLFSLHKGSNFDGVKNSDLNLVNLHYPTTNFVDENNFDIITFNNRYKSKYGAKPSIFVYKGYDMTYDALLRVATYKNTNDSFQTGKTKGLTSNFNYVTTGVSGHTNKAVFIVKHKDFEIIKVE